MAVLDLISWTLKTTKDLKTELLEPRDNGPSREWLLSVQDQEHAAATKLDDNSIAITPSNSVPHEVMCLTAVALTPNDAPSLPNVALVPFSGHPPTGNEEPKSALLRAIHRPDISTPQVDRNRAIGLRWIMRDIKSNRLKLSPVSPEDLRTLVELGLVEMRGDTFLLTDAGATAVI
jgi:hypothetical protein